MIPVNKKDIQLIISDPKAHKDYLQYGIDFLIPEGTPIIASCDGIVIEIKVDSNEGGFKNKYLGNKYLNFITIEHANKELSQYCHLKFNGACVKEGQKVKVGEIIGYSGNVGYISVPHLHFHVCIDNDSKVGWETLEVQFDESLKIIRKESDLTENDKKLLQEMSKQFIHKHFFYVQILIGITGRSLLHKLI